MTLSRKVLAGTAIACAVLLIAVLLAPRANEPIVAGSPSPSTAASTSPSASESPSASPTASAGESYRLTVEVTGAGNGIVISIPAGINCPGVCSAQFPAGTVVTLTPLASPPPFGYETRFLGFSGACTGTACSVTMNQGRTVAASFTLVPGVTTLTVVKSGPDSGGLFIHSMIPPVSTTGIYCGEVCSYDFQIGSTVTLYVVVAVGTTFTGWSGACTGTAECVITITGPVTVTATYNSP